MNRLANTLIAGAFLLYPALVHAQEHRYYDPYHHDYHVWNADEDRAWRHWVVEERHRKYHDWARANRREQREYWTWRHEHHDWR